MARPVPVLPLVNSTTVSPGCSSPSGFGVFDHLQGDAVLFGVARVQVLELGEYRAVQRTGDARQIDQGRIADGIKYGLAAFYV